MRIAILLFISVFVVGFITAQTESKYPRLNEAKWVLGGGIGFDYAVAGGKLGYHCKKNGLSFYAAGSFLPAASVGLQYDFYPKQEDKRLFPYVLLGVFNYSPLNLSTTIEQQNGMEVRVSQAILNSGVNSSIGVNFYTKGRGFFTFAASGAYRPTITTKVDEFNATFNTDYSFNEFWVRFSLAYSFILAKH